MWESLRGNREAQSAVTVLLVEDDLLIRLSTAEMLANLGHSVAEAANAAQALDLLDQRAFDVLMTDLALPGLGGEELAARAIGQQPDLRVVFASGYEAIPNRADQEKLAGAVLLRKPYDERSVADALNAATLQIAT